jgi:hypothetical protein
MSNLTHRPGVELNSGMLGSGVVLLCVGGFLWVTGAAVATFAMVQAARKWVAQLEESPSELAQRRFEQLKVAVAAGSKAWRDQSS